MLLTTGAITTETLTAAILALENLTNRLAVLCLNTTTQPEHSPRVRLLLEDLADALSCCEEDLGTYDEEGFILD